MRVALLGLGVNAGLLVVKLVGGIVGHSYALVADAIESSTDIFASLVVWWGLRVTTRPPDDDYPYGYGKAESLATAVVGLTLLAAALGIAVAAVSEILTPHHTPAPFTLAVIAGVVAVKAALTRRVARLGHELNSPAVEADAWHHRSDAVTSLAAFVGISVAIWGGPGWEAADDWAALVAAALIARNGAHLLRPAVQDLMDRTPSGLSALEIARVAGGVEGVLAVEKPRVRRLGARYYVDLHVQADPGLSLRDAHALGGKVKWTIRQALPAVSGVMIHMEPFEGPGTGG